MGRHTTLWAQAAAIIAAFGLLIRFATTGADGFASRTYSVAFNAFLARRGVAGLGVDRLTDVELSCILLSGLGLATIASALALIFTQGRGLGLKAGALAALLPVVVAVLAYGRLHPFPQPAELPAMAASSVALATVCLTLPQLAFRAARALAALMARSAAPARPRARQTAPAPQINQARMDMARRTHR
ncbi:MAG: hypothetical protein KGL46_09040 [Hyphomicrobiales bacterium]|nr:hypothetical protein [Hyphomicrobiales bacterium]